MSEATKQERHALRMALEAFAGEGDERARMLAAGRAFRDAMPPRRRRPEDDQPYHEKGGKAALKVIRAEATGLLRQNRDEIEAAIGRAMIEGAYPTIRYRRSLGLPNYADVGRICKQVHASLAKNKPRASEEFVCRAMATASLKSAWPEEPNE